MKQLLEWQGYRCALTGRDLTPDNCHADHIVPVSDGGDNTMDNVQLLVAMANTAKGTLPNDEFIQMCIDVARNATPTPLRRVLPE